ncbi:helix-turn-helix domain-containing protein [Stappia sp. MMSF_3263]|uniref:helix-turn-helix domain-containing protein n=1 Tax=Stappia sp. MMSF_3263 TaxID=3046693 RepID=UPI00273EF708|nr:AraC family transcriptional regulator [Stappia sp. MMSF_3263]
MGTVITPEELPQWMDGDLVQDSAPLGWNGLKLKRYHTPPQEVNLPMVCDFAVVAYVNRHALKWRRYDGPWETGRVGPGLVSVLTRAEVSHWRWDSPVEALHVYLPFEAMAATAEAVFERDIEDIQLRNILSAEDPVLTEAAARLASEVGVGGLGGQLYVEALRCQMSVHILRNYAAVAFREHLPNGGLSRPQCRLILEFIEENIGRNISLAELAGVLQLSVFHFSRKFSKEFGCSPYAYVLRKRVEHAKQQLRSGSAPLKVVAADCGFADQSHMTRLFRRFLNVTPAEYRSRSLPF